MKRISRIIFAAAAALSLSCISACGSGGSDNAVEPEKSELIGTFTYQETLGASEADALRITHDKKNIVKGDRSRILSTFYPINANMEGTRISYNMDQRLKLKRDFTYEYEYTVVLGNPGDWGGRFAQIAVDIKGNYTYEEISDGMYSVELSDPTGGTQKLRSYRVTGGGIYGLAMHDSDDCVLDYSYLSGLSGYVFDEYVGSRTVVVDKAEDTQKQLDDDIFYPGLLDYLSQYGTY